MTETPQFDFDADALRERYRLERERRLREDGTAQYIDMSGGFEAYIQDPHVLTPLERAPLEETVETVIIGGGFGGLLVGAHLSNAGITDFRVIEKGADFGGTWYWNRYPGAACDTESYIYMPLLEYLGQMPSEKYARGPELWEHARAIGRHFGLYDRALFQTEVKELRWDETAKLWRIATSRGDKIAARYVVSVTGALHRPKLPGIPGIKSFAGHSFHTSRWDYEYTGGSSMGNLTKLADKRVGIIGTGATAVQCVPYLGEYSKHLYVFQRTPSVVDVRNNRPTEPEWVKSLEPGWQTERMENFNIIVSGGHAEKDLVNDGWTDLLGKFLIIGDFDKQLEQAADPKLIELADFAKMEKVRARVDALVHDKAVAEKLKPYYSLFCKRPCFHDAYLQTFNRDNVTLVDTEGRGVDRITEKGIVVNGVEYELDLIVYATGFEVNEPYTQRSGFKIYGQGGVSLDDKWAHGPETLHGFFTSGFPNLLLVAQAQGGAAANITHMLGEQARHVAYVIAEAKRRGAATIQVDSEAEREWVDLALELSKPRADYNGKCVPGYYNNEGHLDEDTLKAGPYGGGPATFIKLMESWREEGNLAGLILEPADAGTAEKTVA